MHPPTCWLLYPVGSSTCKAQKSPVIRGNFPISHLAELSLFLNRRGFFLKISAAELIRFEWKKSTLTAAWKQQDMAKDFLSCAQLLEKGLTETRKMGQMETKQVWGILFLSRFSLFFILMSAVSEDVPWPRLAFLVIFRKFICLLDKCASAAPLLEKKKSLGLAVLGHLCCV